MKYSYQARTKDGNLENGVIEASTKEAAAALLQKYNISVISIKEEKRPFKIFQGSTLFNKVSKKDLAIFSRQLAVMLDSRVPIVQSIMGLAAQTSKGNFKRDLEKIAGLVQEGNTLSESLAFYPKSFNSFFISLIQSGEASGKISEALYYLSSHLEREYDINSKLKEAMIYPVLVLFVMGVVIIIVMTVIMPKLIDLMEGLGTNVPASTKAMIGMYRFFNAYGWMVILAFVVLVVFIIYYFRTKEGKKIFDQLVFKIPLFGSFLEKVYLMRFAESLSTLISSGLPITNALKITKNTLSNYVYKEIVGEIEKQVSEGEKVSSVLIGHQDRVPAFVIQMIKVGEETGKLDKTLMEIVNFYKKDVDNAVATFATLIEPLLIILLGLGVAVIAASVLSPLYGILGAI